LRLCGGDMGFTSLTYDFRSVFYRTRSLVRNGSVSNFKTFQANRLKLRFKDKDGKNQHTLNGSALAAILAGILENYQTRKGL
jgi:seryl-tRNA synthetase